MLERVRKALGAVGAVAIVFTMFGLMLLPAALLPWGLLHVLPFGSAKYPFSIGLVVTSLVVMMIWDILLRWVLETATAIALTQLNLWKFRTIIVPLLSVAFSTMVLTVLFEPWFFCLVLAIVWRLLATAFVTFAHSPRGTAIFGPQSKDILWN